MAEGKFRQDLYYRLNVFPVQIPPLRERPEDIPLLVHYFVARCAIKISRHISRVPKEAMRQLVAYAWPGNVRELENVIERWVILSPGPALEIPAEMLPDTLPVFPSRPVPQASKSSPPQLSLEHIERNHIVSVLKQTKWRIDGLQGAALVLNIHPSTLRSRMKRLGIQRSAEEFS